MAWSTCGYVYLAAESSPVPRQHMCGLTSPWMLMLWHSSVATLCTVLTTSCSRGPCMPPMCVQGRCALCTQHVDQLRWAIRAHSSHCNPRARLRTFPNPVVLLHSLILQGSELTILGSISALKRHAGILCHNSNTLSRELVNASILPQYRTAQNEQRGESAVFCATM